MEEETYTITIRPPVTVAAFATGLDTDAEVIVNAAAGMGEEVKEDGILSSELAVLIGEQWGYTVKVEEPEVVEEAPVPEPEPIAEPEPEPVAEKASSSLPRLRHSRRSGLCLGASPLPMRPCDRRWSRCSDTSIMARRLCSTPSARPTWSRAKRARSHSTSARIRWTSTADALPS